ncbi:unnamed protein product [Protopolystoma xenopodis]|uniref:Uncharacterized protein n=1 Tax=Protopolystoma xenopodis TaxID=117903 RepID=A0A448XB97_9PLAT|nr:unnamed protein product [Protopolystoma xenopodis]
MSLVTRTDSPTNHARETHELVVKTGQISKQLRRCKSNQKICTHQQEEGADRRPAELPKDAGFEAKHLLNVSTEPSDA